MGANHHSRLCGIPQAGLDAPDDGRHREGAGHLALIGAKAPAAWRCWLQSFCRTAGSPTIAVRPEERPSSAVVSGNLTGARTGAHLAGQGYAWKTTGCDGVSIFLAGIRHTAPCAGAGRKAGPTPAHRGQASNGTRSRACSFRNGGYSSPGQRKMPIVRCRTRLTGL